MSVAQQRALVAQADPARSVYARRQALGLARSSFYYQPCGESAYNLDPMCLLDEEFTQPNFKGVLGLRDHLRLAGHLVNAKRVRRLVRLMGHEPVYPKPRLSVPDQGVTSYPYLLRDRPATAPNEGWSTDITYVPMAKGFLYLAAVLDWHSCYVLSWQLSNTLDVGFCLLALTDALRVAPAPHSFHSDQGITSLLGISEKLLYRWQQVQAVTEAGSVEQAQDPAYRARPRTSVWNASWLFKKALVIFGRQTR